MSSSLMSILVLAIVASAAVVGAVDPTKEEWEKKQADTAADKAATAADDAKMAAVNKVTTMLDDLQKQVIAEGEAEAETYNKFACWCKTTQTEKADAISSGKDTKAELTASINDDTAHRGRTDTKIDGLKDSIKKAEDEQKKADGERAKTLGVYKKNDADIKAGLESIKSAMKVLKASETDTKTPSLVQLQSVSQTVQQAMLLADAMGLVPEESRKLSSSFLQAPGVAMEDYKFHSSSVIDMLEKLLDSFRKTKKDLDAAEVESVAKYDSKTQMLTDKLAALNHELEEAKALKAELTDSIESSSQELTTTSAQLLDDMDYLDELNTICSHKAKTWDQRSKMRADEIVAITSAAGIIKSTVAEKTQSSTIRFMQKKTKVTLGMADAVASSDGAMEAIEAEAEENEAADGGALGFLQRRSIQKHDPNAATQYIMSLLRSQGKELKSTLLTQLADQMAGDPLAKVKKLIQELIERLLQEAANEANQKGWCDKAMADAKDKRKYSAEKVAAMNAKMAKLEALSAKLAEEIKVLGEEIDELKKNQLDATNERNEESAENANTVKEAEAGLGAVKMAIDILDKFYKTSAKATVDLSLAQGPMDDAPDAGFDNGEAYKGAGAESGGIIGMMEVIQSDFERTISETKSAEEAAESEYKDFMTKTSMSLAEKDVASKQKTKLKDEADAEFGDSSATLTDQMKILTTSIEELMELKATCIDTGMSYEDRVAMREQEIASLKKALCILGAYAEYGPDGLADKC